jgi:hypothetical protein
MSDKPKWWFRPIDESDELIEEPKRIEYLKVWTGETFIHTGGTAFWRDGRLDLNLLIVSGITHWRIPTNHHEIKK